MDNKSIEQSHIETSKLNILNRRNFLKIGLITAVAHFSPCKAHASFTDFFGSKRTLSLYNTHTREKLKVSYWEEDQYLPEALDEINYVLRDHHNNKVKMMDPKLLDLLYRINLKIKYCDSFHIVSGYRSPETNAALRRRSRGVAKRSLHLTGQAVDIRVPRCRLSYLRNTAKGLRGGGVGYYRSSNFVHVDTGRVRYW